MLDLTVLHDHYSLRHVYERKVWKGEAFRLWVDLWASLYDDESRSAELLHEMHDSYYLVAVVDNDFIDGNLWEVRVVRILVFLLACFKCWALKHSRASILPRV